MTVEYKTKGVCAKAIEINVENGIILSVSFIGGCSGNLQGIARLVEGMQAGEAIRRLKGIRCGMRYTSCPDQLAKALTELIRK